MVFDRTSRINTYMLIREITKPKTPEQQRLASLQATAKRTQQAAKTERERQKIEKAQQSLAKVKQPGTVI